MIKRSEMAERESTVSQQNRIEQSFDICVNRRLVAGEKVR